MESTIAEGQISASFLRYTIENAHDMLDLCDRCEIKEAEIFQYEGKYCVVCWQEKTLPKI
jgi:hypothetical protein